MDGMSKSNPNQLRSQNREVMTEVLRRLGSQDFSGACALLSEDVICDWPYPPMADSPKEIRGRDALEQFFSGGMTAFDPYNYDITEVFDLVDPNQMIAEYRSNSRYKLSGAPYRNQYLGIFHFTDGLVSYWREYINPVTVAEILATAPTTPTTPPV
jgi:ketosteroid isomerase-like protein